MRQAKKTQPRRRLAMLLALALCVSCVIPGLAANETAKTVQLLKTEGTVSVANSSGKKLSIRDSMRLYNGYQTETEQASYAWFNLDSTKLSKLDEVSEMELRKSGKKLELLLNSGNLYFNVTEPLETDETLNIRTSTMVVGIRGTCGWVKVVDQWHSRLYVLEGRVTCSVTDPVTGQTKTTVLTGGEWASFVVYPQDRTGDKCDIIRQQKYTESAIPGFIQTELAGNSGLCEKIYQDSGLDLRNLTMSEALQSLRADQAAMAAQLNASKQQQSAQENHVSADPVWENNQNNSSSESSGSSSGGSGTTTTPPSGITNTTNTTTQALTMTMPVTIPQIQSALNQASASSVTVNPGTGNNTLTQAAGETLTVPANKTLTLSSGVDLVENGTLNVDGTLNINGNLDNYGTITVTSANSLHVSGYFRNHGTTGTVNNISSGHIVPANGIENLGGTISISGNAVLESSAAVTVDNYGTMNLIGGTISNTSSSGSAIKMEKTADIPTTFTETSATNVWSKGALPVADANGGEPNIDGYKVVIGSEQTTLRPTGGVEGGVLTYTVSFDANGGRWSGTAPTITVKQNTALGTPPNAPTRPGYTFVSWQDNGGITYTNETVVSSNLTLYAQWKAESGTETPGEETVTITFVSEGSTVASIDIDKGGSLPYLPAAPARTGYTFTGWSGIQSTYSADTTLTAQWELDTGEETVHVAFYYNIPGDTFTAAYPEFDLLKGQSLNYPPDWTMDELSGYRLLGWNTKADGSGDYYGRHYYPDIDSEEGDDTDWEQPVNADLTLYGIWEKLDTGEETPEKITITFINGSDPFDDIQIEKGGSLPYLSTKPTTSPDGYTAEFTGWYYYDANSNRQTVYSGTTFSTDTTLYAEYALIPLVDFVLHEESADGTVGGGAWTIEVSSDDSFNMTGLQVSTKPKPAPASLDEPDAQAYGTSFTLTTVPLEPTKEGYRFVGWRLPQEQLAVGEDPNAVYTSEQLWRAEFTEPTTLYPVWKPAPAEPGTVVAKEEWWLNDDNITAAGLEASLAVYNEVTIHAGSSIDPTQDAKTTLNLNDALTIPVGKVLYLDAGVNMVMDGVDLINCGLIAPVLFKDGSTSVPSENYTWPTLTVDGGIVFNLGPVEEDKPIESPSQVKNGIIAFSFQVKNGMLINYSNVVAETFTIKNGALNNSVGRRIVANVVLTSSSLYHYGHIYGNLTVDNAIAGNFTIQLAPNSIVDGDVTIDALAYTSISDFWTKIYVNSTSIGSYFQTGGFAEMTGNVSLTASDTLFVLNSGMLTMNCNLTTGDLDTGNDSVYNVPYGTFLVQDGTLTIDSGTIYLPIKQAGRSVTINGGELSGGYTFSGGTLSVTGGKFTDGNGIQEISPATGDISITLSGGEFKGCVITNTSGNPLTGQEKLVDYLDTNYIVHNGYNGDGYSHYYILPPTHQS